MWIWLSRGLISVGRVKYYDQTIPLLERRCFQRLFIIRPSESPESYRINPEVKDFLKGLKRK
jgi:hypothetical protein